LVKIHVHHGTSCEITAPTDKLCGNESKIRLAGQNYIFFQFMFTIFQFLRPKGVVLEKNSKYIFAFFGVNVLKCNDSVIF
jgi:hypothetical protein